MTHATKDNTWLLAGTLFKSHPWHGIPVGEEAPVVVSTYIEVTPSDTVKYEIDKETGHLMVDRPQKYSNVCPTLYGFIPQTYCAEQVAALCSERLGRDDIVGDGDPLDICVLTENNITHGDVLLKARPIGGLRMIDGNEADDKILAVLPGDAAYGSMQDIVDCPAPMLDRLRHYFLTYKQAPDDTDHVCEIPEVYGYEHAYEVIARSQADYDARFRDLDKLLGAALS